MARFFRRRGEAAAEPAAPPPAGPSEAVAAERDVEQAVDKTRRTWFSRIGGMFRRGLDEALWEELEETLIAADTGAETAGKLLANLKQRVREDGIREPERAQEALKEELAAILSAPPARGKLWPADGASVDRLTLRQAQGERGAGEPAPSEGGRPAVILVIGVNGTGKTTSIAKLAHAYKQAGHRALLAAADTFRAAAIDQVKQWGERVGVDVIAHRQGADAGAVVFDALSAAESRGAEVVIIDTAGRLHTKTNLMEELRKVHRIIQRKDPTAPHEVLLVLDATSGQNALHQAKYFTEAVGVTGILLAKLDGTAKGGVVFGVCDQLGIPVRFVGTGEGAGDLAPFEPRRFVDALFA